VEEEKKSNDWFGFCPNVTFEDDEFKDDNKALNDQDECKGTNSFFVFLKLIIFKLFRLCFYFFNIASIRFVLKNTNVCRHQSI
jgi:hypothetical protein